jgi:uncharacterized membrane protein
MVQAIWTTLHGHFLETTGPSGHQHDRLGFHIDPLLLLLAPLFWVWSSPIVLLVVQAVAVASGALPVFWLARKHLESPRAGAHFAFAYLLYPATQYSAFTAPSSFHSVALAVPLVLYAIWFLDEDRLVAFSAVALLAFATKEEIPLAVGCLGIWYAVRRRRRLVGLSIFAAGLAVTLFDFLWVIPHLSPSGVDPFADRYGAIGGTPGGVLRKVFSDPLAFVHVAASRDHAIYLGLVLLPFLGLSLLEPLLLLGALPDLAIGLLSNLHTSIPSHWTEGVIPFVVAASVFGAARFRRDADRLSFVVLLATTAAAVYSPLALLGSDVPALGSPVVAAEARAVNLVPDAVPIAATNRIAAHLSERRYLYNPPHIGRSRWIVVDVNDPTYGNNNGLRRFVKKYQANHAWRLVFSSHGVIVLHEPPSSP